MFRRRAAAVEVPTAVAATTGHAAIDAAPRPPDVSADLPAHVTVASIKAMCASGEIVEVRWRDGAAKRRAIAVIDDWRGAEDIVADAVRRCYQRNPPRRVDIPVRAWKA